MFRPLAVLLAITALFVGVFIGIRAARKSPSSLVAAGPSNKIVAPADGPADMILTNAHIETMDDGDHEWATAAAIQGEKIAAVWYSGSDEKLTSDEIQKWIGPQTKMIDLHGQFVMPGFNDAHLHLASAAYAQLEVNAEGAKSLAEFQQRIRDRLKDYEPGEWIVEIGRAHV